MLKSIVKFLLASVLIISGIAVGTTVFAAKGVDKLGDDLQEKIYH
ncbi:hypothetical protein [Leuconostoc rapi]|nr:hypothetical protein [Leuconostoc rapi]MBM7435049.1 peptidoglycan hydrolase CwlO-like protein [Leuconostoc rapi]